MIYYLTPADKQLLEEFGVKPVEGQKFRPGIDCPGREPFTLSHRCHLTCTGPGGIRGVRRTIPLLCFHADDTIRVAEKNARGALGSRPLASLSSF